KKKNVEIKDKLSFEKLSQSMGILSILIMILTIGIFIFTMREVKSFHLRNYGKIETAEIKSTEYSIKGIPFNHIEYGKRYTTNLIQKDNHQSGDSIKVIYSLKDPRIIEYLDDYK